MDMTPERIGGVVADIYASVGSGTGFHSALRGIIELMNGSSGMLFTPLRGPADDGFGFVDHFDVALDARFRSDLRGVAPWDLEAERRNLLRTGMTVTDEILVPDDVLRKTAFYHEAHVPLDVGRVCCSVVSGDEDSSLPRTYLSIYRGVNAPAFAAEESRVLHLLAPHVRQALHLAHRLAFAETEQASSREVLHRLECGIVLLERNRKLLFLNRSAEHLCVGHRGVQLVKRGPDGCVLEASHPRENVRLQRAIDLALRLDETAAVRDEDARSAPVVIHGPHGEPLLTITVLPLPVRFRVAGRTGVALLLENPVASRPVDDQLFHMLFRLTPAECRIARALLGGEPPKLIADRLAVSENTVRTQIKALYGKTSTRGVGALVALLARATGSVACAPDRTETARHGNSRP